MMLASLGCLIIFVSAQEKTTDGVQVKNGRDLTSASSSRRKLYLDVRERKAATLTFNWRSVRAATYDKKKLQRDGGKPLQLSEGVVELDAERVLVPDLQGTYTILRTPDLTCVRVQKELPAVGENALGKSEHPLLWDYYYLGDTGEIVISVFRGSARSADSSMVHIGYPDGYSGFGFPSPSIGPLVGEMVFLGGVSPFRLFGAEVNDWKLVEVNEDEWVFELKIEEARRKHFEGLIPSGEQVRFYLSRKHGDAPLRLEFRSEHGYEKWETLAFTQSLGIQIPQTIICEVDFGGTLNQVLYEFQGASQTTALMIDIPLGTPVCDWRHIGLKLWRARDKEKCIETEWRPELLGSLLATLGSQDSQAPSAYK